MQMNIIEGYRKRLWQ